MSTQRYLRLRAQPILWPLCGVYLGVVVNLAPNVLSVSTFSIWYWLILGPLGLIMYFGIWVSIVDGVIVHYTFFLPALRVPVNNVTRIVKGPPYGIAHTDCMYYYYLDKKGVEKYVITVLFNHKPREVARFITDLTRINPAIALDDNLKKWLLKKGASLSQQA